LNHPKERGIKPQEIKTGTGIRQALRMARLPFFPSRRALFIRPNIPSTAAAAPRNYAIRFVIKPHSRR
jgi:hypothetical protein